MLFATRFDLKTLAIWYSPLFITAFIGLFYKASRWSLVNRVLFVILYLSSLVYGLVAVFYYETSKTIVGVELFQMIKGQSISILLGYAIDFWWVVVIALVFMWLILKLEKRTHLVLERKQSLVVSGVLLVFIVFFARGGVALKPLNLLDAYGNLSNVEATTAVTPTYVLLESIGKQSITYVEFIPDDSLKAKLTEDHLKLSSPLNSKPNICLILLESFGKEYTGLNTVGRVSYTPFLDSLARESRTFTNAYANGLRSMDAVAAIYAGIPSFMKSPFIGSLYTNSEIESLPVSLKDAGYHTSFFHGADELSMGFKPFLLAQGLEVYKGRQQYSDESDFDGTWGIFDEPYLQYFASELGTQSQPWCSGVFTLSSHHPYTIPPGYEYLPKGTAAIHQSIGYTDEALKRFFATAQTTPWFKNTVFIITADHTSINETQAYSSYRGKYEIPLLIYAPSLVAPGIDSSIVQQIDLLPTIKSYAGIEQTIAIGRPLYDSANRLAYQYDGNVYVCSNDSFSLLWNGSSKSELYAYKKDAAHKRDIADEYPLETQRLLSDLKVFIQKYNYRLLNNDFK